MEIVGKILLFSGFILALVNYIYIVIFAFKLRFSAGLFCLLITPLYAFLSDLREDFKIRIALKVWVASLFMIILGVFVLIAV